jgi:transcriptional antiterminator RfaH
MSESTFSPSRALESTENPWFVVQYKPNAEGIAKRNLLRQGLKIFAPFEERTARKSHGLIHTCKALFPGYLFVSFDQNIVRWRTVNSTIGVIRLVRFTEDRPAQISSALISDLMQRCDHSGKLLPPRQLRSGDTVQVTKGPFADFIGNVEQITADKRIWVLLDILGKNTRVATRFANLKCAF